MLECRFIMLYVPYGKFFFQRINLFLQGCSIHFHYSKPTQSFPKSKRLKETPITHSECSDFQCEVQPWMSWWVKDKHAIRQDLYKRFTGGREEEEIEGERGRERMEERERDR